MNQGKTEQSGIPAGPQSKMLRTCRCHVNWLQIRYKLNLRLAYQEVSHYNSYGREFEPVRCQKNFVSRYGPSHFRAGPVKNKPYGALNMRGMGA